MPNSHLPILDWRTIMNAFPVIAYDRGKLTYSGKIVVIERYTFGRKLTQQQYNWLKRFSNVAITNRLGNHTIYLRGQIYR